MRGQRNFEFLPYKVLLEGFEFNLTAPLDAPSLDANRSIAKWTVLDFNTNDFINAPEGNNTF